MTVSYDAHKFLHIGLVSDIVSYDAHKFFHIVLVSDNTKSVKKLKLHYERSPQLACFCTSCFPCLRISVQ